MDDPRVPNTGIKSEDDFQRLIPLSAQNFGITNMHDWIKRLEMSAKRLQEISYDPYDFIGIRARIRAKFAKVFKKDYFPKVQ
jgi:hypothetical protein